MGPAGLAQRRHVRRLGAEHARGPLDERLNDHGGQLAGVGRHGGARLGRPTRIGVPRGADDGEAQGVEDGAEHPAVPQRQGADGVAVIGVAQGQELRAPLLPPVGPVLEGDLEGLLDRDGAVGRKQEVGRVDRHQRGQGLGQLDHHGVAVPEHGAVGHLAHLGHQGGIELGYPVPQRVHPQGRDRIEVAPAVDIDQLASLGPVNDQGGVVDVGPHLREAVPDDRSIPLDPPGVHHVSPCSCRSRGRTCDRGARPRPCGPAGAAGRTAAL